MDSDFAKSTLEVPRGDQDEVTQDELEMYATGRIVDLSDYWKEEWFRLSSPGLKPVKDKLDACVTELRNLEDKTQSAAEAKATPTEYHALTKIAAMAKVRKQRSAQ